MEGLAKLHNLYTSYKLEMKTTYNLASKLASVFAPLYTADQDAPMFKDKHWAGRKSPTATLQYSAYWYETESSDLKVIHLVCMGQSLVVTSSTTTWLTFTVTTAQNGIVHMCTVYMNSGQWW